ncbi:MAG: hypothetical protein HQK51_08520, partial [Oligoflexia bacterium]|nr:hypothetical protein [Oligoflexia bacterium]
MTKMKVMKMMKKVFLGLSIFVLLQIQAQIQVQTAEAADVEMVRLSDALNFEITGHGFKVLAEGVKDYL